MKLERLFCTLLECMLVPFHSSQLGSLLLTLHSPFGCPVVY